jgi:hypothetical protein
MATARNVGNILLCIDTSRAGYLYTFVETEFVYTAYLSDRIVQLTVKRSQIVARALEQF